MENKSANNQIRDVLGMNKSESLEICRYKQLTDAVRRTLENSSATYGEAIEALEGVARQIKSKMNKIRIDLPEGK